jgi:hypothetical protein
MNVPVHPDGSAEIEEGLSEPEDYVDLRADKDVLILMSNCPQFYNHAPAGTRRRYGSFNGEKIKGIKRGTKPVVDASLLVSLQIGGFAVTRICASL